MEKNVKFIRIRLCVRCVRMSECVSACVFFFANWHRYNKSTA